MANLPSDLLITAKSVCLSSGAPSVRIGGAATL